MYKLKNQSVVPVDLGDVSITGGLLAATLDTVRRVTVADVLDKFERDRGGAVENFDRLVRGDTGFHAGPPWYDGLIYESILGASDLLAAQPDADLESRIEGYIERIAAAQACDADGSPP